MKLWEKGMLSNETLLQTYGYDLGQEVERRKAEEANGIPDTLTPPAGKNAGTKTKTGDGGDDTVTVDRPALDDSERHSDPAKSVKGDSLKGATPKPKLNCCVSYPYRCTHRDLFNSLRRLHPHACTHKIKQIGSLT